MQNANANANDKLNQLELNTNIEVYQFYNIGVTQNLDFASGQPTCYLHGSLIIKISYLFGCPSTSYGMVSSQCPQLSGVDVVWGLTNVVHDIE